MLIPIFFGGGSIINSFIVNRISPHKSFMFVPGIICMVFGFINYTNPGNYFGKFVNYIL